MNSDLETVISMMEKDHRVSPALLQMKMNITQERALELCHSAWHYRAKDAFFKRGFGVSMSEFYRGDELDD